MFTKDASLLVPMDAAASEPSQRTRNNDKNKKLN